MLREYLAILRHIGDAGAGDAIGLLPRHIRAPHQHAAGARRQQSGDGLERRALARTIAAHERQRLAARHLQRHAEQHLACPIGGVEPFDGEFAAPSLAHKACSAPR